MSTTLSPDENLTSLELWGASKIIGRECSTINKDYFVCKQEKGGNPELCFANAIQAINCAQNVYVHIVV